MFNVSILRRSIQAVTCAGVASLMLASCGGGGSSDAGQSTPSAAVSSAPDALLAADAANVTSPATAAAAAPAASASTPDSGPFGQDAGAYALSFSEEFDKGLDPSVWNDHVWYEGSSETKNYSVDNGSLKIWPQRDGGGKFFNRTVDTDGHFYQTYGYFEVEAKLPVGKGTWPAFWLFNHIDNRRPEIDIMEAYAGGGPSSGWSDGSLHPTAYGATIWKDANVQGGFKMIQTPDLSSDFHKYAIKWEANKQTFYFDGKEVMTQDVTMGDPMYLMLDLWFGSASGAGDDSTPTGKGNAYEVNYVRAWKFK
ncbi:MAG: glycoside hydrolase family 16 protein [Herminiimonas sp.]|nr:glycoside hydrolase family 16 protein [Herminiimonas sp.]MDB5853104.1 glycoside hydrolase family 16 protein [Herminiimonas sp.]